MLEIKNITVAYGLATALWDVSFSCDRIAVLDYGEKIAEDVPDKVVNNPDVIKAYLGERYSARH